MEYSVQPYRAEMQDNVAALHAGLINASRGLSRSYLRWKYLENPLLPDSPLQVVMQGHRVVAMRGLFGTAWHLDPASDPVVLPHADDLVVHPEHRNRGLFLLLNQALGEVARARGFPAIISLSAGETTQKLQLVAGWRTLGDLERSHRVPPPRAGGRGSRFGGLNPLRVRGAHRLRWARRLIGFVPGGPPSNRAVDRAVARVALPRGDGVLFSREADVKGLASLAKRVRSNLIRSVRTEALLRWRLSNPHRRYRFLYWHDSRLRGYMVLAWAGRNPQRAIIADYVVEDETVLADFLGALARSPETELCLMHSTLPDTHAARFRQAGFALGSTVARNPTRRFQYYPLTPSGGLTPDEARPAPYPDRWRLHLLDTMGA